MLVMAKGWLDREERRLVDDRNVFVLVHDIQFHGGGDYRHRWDLICEDHSERISRINEMVGKNGFSVQKKRVIMVT